MSDRLYQLLAASWLLSVAFLIAVVFSWHPTEAELRAPHYLGASTDAGCECGCWAAVDGGFWSGDCWCETHWCVDDAGLCCLPGQVMGCHRDNGTDRCGQNAIVDCGPESRAFDLIECERLQEMRRYSSEDAGVKL
jgi:hypothetical protein